jgi:pimeloyl-ACP methyl ester carboxylesterase
VADQQFTRPPPGGHRFGDGAGNPRRGGQADRGRPYAAAIPLARFQLLPGTGHSPQLETPDQVIHAI